MIGPLRERITLLEPARTPDGAGGASVDWTPSGRVWAASEDRTSGLARLAGRYARTVRRRYTLRADAPIGPETRIGQDGRVFRIVSVQRREGRKPYLLLGAEEVR